MSEVDVKSLEPNSYTYKKEKAKRGKVAPVVKRDKIVSTKKPLSKKFAESFVSEDAKDLKSWVVMDVIIPGIKATLIDMLSMAFFGETASRSRRRDRYYDRDRRDYSSYYRDSRDDRRSSKRKDEYYDSDEKIDFRNIVLRERVDAERVIESMHHRIQDNGNVSVAELLDLIDVPGRYTDNNWGWDDERDIKIRRVSSGYLIDVSEPRYLD